MSAVTFDKLAYSEALKAGGFTPEQATVQANALDVALRETVATKHDLKILRVEIEHDLELTRTEIHAVEQRMTIKLGGMLVVAVGVFAALVKIL